MAYQPKSYRKFVATAATATLVASAFAPFASAASFKDVDENSTYKEATDFLFSKGVTGFADGTFKPTENITRIQAAEITAKVLGLDLNAPDAGFTDIPDRESAKKAVNALKAAGITQGKTANTFASNQLITRGELAVWITRGFKELKADDKLDTFPDVFGDYTAAVDVLVDNKITLGYENGNFGTQDNATRGQYALFMDRAFKAVEAQKEVKVDSVTAVNAKTIEVKFTKAVEDTSKATVELLRGTFKQNVTLKWADDKKSVQLVGAGNFQAAEYTVKISGLTKEALTGAVKIEAQKVASIEILSDVAVLSANVTNTIEEETATVGYVVKDQYGTDITDTTTLTTNGASVEAVKGKIKLKDLKGKKVGDIVPIVLVHAQSGVTVSQTVKLSAASTVADIVVDGVYNAKGEKVELNDATKASEVFLVVELKDQYGNAIDAKGKGEVNGVIVTNTNPLVVGIDPEKITTQEIGNKTKFVVKFKQLDKDNQFKGGSAELLFISTLDGKTFKHTVNVSETKVTDSVAISQPEYAIAGEKVKLPITVTDKEGNIITDAKLLAHATKGIKVDGVQISDAKKFEVKDGQVYFLLENPGNADSYKTVVVTSATNKVATTTFKVTEAAKPVAVRGLKEKLVLVAEKSKTIEFANVNVEDQYGRTMKELPDGYTVVVEDIKAEEGKTPIVTVANNKVTAGKKNGTATITISLQKDGKSVSNSAVEQQVQVTDGKEYTSYEIKEVGLVNAETGKDFIVQGVLPNGGKVALDGNADYTVTTNVEGVTIVDGKVVVGDVWTVDNKAVTEREVKATVTINADGSKVEKTFKVSKAAAKVQDFFFTASTLDTKYSDAKAIAEVVANVGEGGYTIASPIDVDDKATILNVATVDQYDAKKVVTLSADSVTVVPEKAAEVNIAKNGTKEDATVTLATGVSEAKVTLKVTIGAATKELKVTLKAAK